jgi:hypothetical protein
MDKYANNTSSDPSSDEFRQPANVAAQPQLGLLSKQRSRLSCINPPGAVASRKSLKVSADV